MNISLGLQCQKTVLSLLLVVGLVGHNRTMISAVTADDPDQTSKHQQPLQWSFSSSIDGYYNEFATKYNFEVQRRWAKGNSTFTEGLFCYRSNTTSARSFFVESCGLWGQSKVNVYSTPLDQALPVANVSQKEDGNDSINLTLVRTLPLPGSIFGEGIAYLPLFQEMWQLSYKSQIFLTFRLGNRTDTTIQPGSEGPSLQYRSKIPYPSGYFAEGWGLTARQVEDQNGQPVQLLYMTDGTETIHVLRISETKNDNDDTTKHVQVVQQLRILDDKGKPLSGLNDLTWDANSGALWVCVYGTTCVAQVIVPFVNVSENSHAVSQHDGFVDGFLDLRMLQPPTDALHMNVLNGVAHRADENLLVVTGKLWDNIYELNVTSSTSKGQWLPPRLRSSFQQSCRNSIRDWYW